MTLAPSIRAAAQAAAAVPPLLNPRALRDTAPPLYAAHFETTAGDFTVEVHRGGQPLYPYLFGVE